MEAEKKSFVRKLGRNRNNLTAYERKGKLQAILITFRFTRVQSGSPQRTDNQKSRFLRGGAYEDSQQAGCVVGLVGRSRRNLGSRSVQQQCPRKCSGFLRCVSHGRADRNSQLGYWSGKPSHYG